MQIRTLKTLIIGSGGYVGSAVARALNADRHEVHGLARTPESFERMKADGIIPLAGSFDDLPALAAAVRDYNCVVFTPAIFPIALEQAPLRAILDALEGTDITFVYTSGTNVFAKTTRDGSWHPMSYSEYDTPIPPIWGTPKLVCERMVLAAASKGLRAMVVRPPLIWGNGASYQVPVVFSSVAKTGSACYIGRGLHTYSNVHVDDLAEIFRLAIDRGIAGAVYHAVAGEANFRSIAEAVARTMDCEARSIDYDEACRVWDPYYVMFGMSANSRTRPERTQAELGWKPRHIDMLDDIANGSYRAAFAGG